MIMERPAGLPVDVLRGFRIGVTSDRRSADLITALERRGALVLHYGPEASLAEGDVLMTLENRSRARGESVTARTPHEEETEA